MKNWIKGFGIGLVLIFVAFAIVISANLMVIFQTGDYMHPYHALLLVLMAWYGEVAILIPVGSIPRKVSLNALMARTIFVWGPVSLGWYLAHHMASYVFYVGLIVSSTCVGYNLVATNVQKKT